MNAPITRRRPSAYLVVALGTSFVAILGLVGPPTVTAMPRFSRSDSNGDGMFDIADPINLLSYLFLGTGVVNCEDGSAGSSVPTGIRRLQFAHRS